MAEIRKIILLLILLIFVIGCTEKPVNETTEEPQPEVAPPEEPKEKEQKEVEEVAPKSDEELPMVQEEVVEETDTPSNIICQKIPLTNQLSPGDVYYCFAAVNHNPEFCQKIEVDP